MTSVRTSSTSAPSTRRRHRFRVASGEDLSFTLLVVLAAAIAGYTVAGSRLLAAGIAATAVAIMIVTRLRFALAMLGASIPFAMSVSGNHLGLNVSASD